MESGLERIQQEYCFNIDFMIQPTRRETVSGIVLVLCPLSLFLRLCLYFFLGSLLYAPSCLSSFSSLPKYVSSANIAVPYFFFSNEKTFSIRVHCIFLSFFFLMHLFLYFLSFFLCFFLSLLCSFFLCSSLSLSLSPSHSLSLSLSPLSLPLSVSGSLSLPPLSPPLSLPLSVCLYVCSGH